MLLVCILGASARADPKIVCTDPMFDFGARRWGEAFDLSYTIRNDGDAPLKISQVWTQWTYPMPEPPAGALGPGERLTIKIPMKMQSHSYYQQLPGELEIVSNDP